MLMTMMMLNTDDDDDDDEDNDDDEEDNNMKTTKRMRKTTTMVMTTTTMRERCKKGKPLSTLEKRKDLFTLVFVFVSCLGPLLSHFPNQKVSLSHAAREM